MSNGSSGQALDALVAARLELRAIPRLPETTRPADEASAYVLQGDLHERLEAAGVGGFGGYKIGCTTPVMQAYMGIPNPCFGGVLESGYRSADGRSVPIAFDDHVRAGVECEILARLAADLPASDDPYDSSTVAPAVGSLSAAIEIVDDRWVDFRAVDTPSLIADDFFGDGCVVGAPVEAWRELELPELMGTMTVNGKVVGTGRGADVLGHPLESLAWLANQRSGRGLGLRAGEFVLLGSLVETAWVSRGDAVEITIDGLGRAAATFD